MTQFSNSPGAASRNLDQTYEMAASFTDERGQSAIGLDQADGRTRILSASEGPAVCTGLHEVEGVIRASWNRRYKLEVHIASDLPHVSCDPVSLQAAVVSLLLNARDAMPKGGVILLRAEMISKSVIPSIDISVTDAGVGMTAETLARAFEPFFTTKSDGLGGVGLPMVERFVYEAQGRILVESEFGVGTTVIMRLPAFNPKN